MIFYYDRFSGQSGIGQYYKYLDNNLYLQDIRENTKDVLNYQIVEMRRSIVDMRKDINNNSSKEQYLSADIRDAVNDATSIICGKLDAGFISIKDGFDSIKNNINEVNSSIQELQKLFDWKMDLVIEELKITNFYLGNITKLLKLPDSQKQMHYYIEKGIGFFKNASLKAENEEFFDYALEEFQKALSIDSREFLPLYYAGLVHFKSKKNCDIFKAQNYFENSAKFAKAKAYISSEGSKQSLTDGFTTVQFLSHAAASLNYASRCNYILDLDKAIKYAGEAFEIDKSNPAYGFQLAKCLAANNMIDDAVGTLTKVISIDPFYMEKIFLDRDFYLKPQILKALKTIASNTIKKVEDEIQYLEELSIGDHPLKQELRKLKQGFNRKNYVNAVFTFRKLFGSVKGLSQQIREENLRYDFAIKQKLIAEQNRRIAYEKASALKRKNRLKKLLYTLIVSEIFAVYCLSVEQLKLFLNIQQILPITIIVATLGITFSKEKFKSLIIPICTILSCGLAMLGGYQEIKYMFNGEFRSAFGKHIYPVLVVLSYGAIFYLVGLIVAYMFRIIVYKK